MSSRDTQGALRVTSSSSHLQSMKWVYRLTCGDGQQQHTPNQMRPAPLVFNHLARLPVISANVRRHRCEGRSEQVSSFKGGNFTVLLRK